MNTPARIGRWFVAVLGVAVMPGVVAFAGDDPKPGVHEDWNGLDKVVINEVFHLSDYSLVQVLPFDTKGTPLPDKGDNTYEPVVEALQMFSARVVHKMQEALEVKVEAAESAADPAEAKAETLIVRGRVTEMNPGSHAARFWGGFGAGHTRVAIECEVVDAQTGKVLVRMTHARASSGTKSYERILRGDTRDLGEDVAKLLKQFE
jgi:hypothetical protein